jgi:hypothetical protein
LFLFLSFLPEAVYANAAKTPRGNPAFQMKNGKDAWE